MTLQVHQKTPWRLPRHVAIIMDGNGRWARSRGMERFRGHLKGMDVVDEIVTVATRLKIEYLTLFTFSTENWCRPQPEVAFLMWLLNVYLARERKRMMRENIRLRVVGQWRELPAKNVRQIEETIGVTQANTGLNLILALNYGGRRDIATAASKMITQSAGEIEVTEDTIGAQLATAGIPDPACVIRTAGEMRFSNFLLWQMAYSEFFFSNTLWPDFNQEEFRSILYQYTKRERRFGRVVSC